ncbi:MAG: ABC transporter permease [Actinomycetes bacterium]
MPAPSSDFPKESQAPGSDYFPSSDLLESSSMATELVGPGGIADGHVRELESLHFLDPDQVSADAIKRRLGLGFWLAAGWVGFISLLAVLAPYLPIQSPTKVSSCIKCPISAAHWLGTDSLGRDVFSRIVWGARVSLTVGLIAITFGLILGGLIGLIAGFYKGRTESLLMGAMDVLLAFPALLLALAIITFTNNRTIWVVSMAIGIVSIAPSARLVRASTLMFGQREFVLASRTMGASNRRIIAREIFPNVVLPLLSFAIIGVAVAIVAEGGLAFLGLSVAPPTPTWGGMINEGRNVLETDPQIALIPSAVLFMTVLMLNFAGDRVREYFDVKEGGL